MGSIADKILNDERFTEKKAEAYKSKKLCLICKETKNVLEMSEGKIFNPDTIYFVLDTLKDVIGYIFNEEISFKESEENTDDSKEFTLFCMGEELMTFGIQKMPKNRNGFKEELKAIINEIIDEVDEEVNKNKK